MRKLIVWIALSCVAWTQEPAAPAPELSRYDALLGSWKSQGTVAMPPGAEAPWTATSHTRRVLGGHFVRTDTRIELGGEAGTLGFITFYGWDAEKQRHVLYEVSNMGTLHEGEVIWLDDRTMMTMSAREAMGQHMVERWITKLKDGMHEFVGEEAVDDGEWHEHVRGKATKLEQDRPVSLADLGPFMTTRSPEMAKAAEMVGHYSLEGSFRMMPGVPPVEFTGTETARPLFGGTALEFTATGEPGNWKGWSALVHDTTAGHYRMVGLNSMGMAHTNDGWYSDGTWIFTSAGTFQGTPGVNRMLLWTDDSGALTKASSHSISGTADPYVSFEGTYTREGETAMREASAPRER